MKSVASLIFNLKCIIPRHWKYKAIKQSFFFVIQMRLEIKSAYYHFSPYWFLFEDKAIKIIPEYIPYPDTSARS